MGFFTTEEFKLITNTSDKKGNSRRAMRFRIRRKIENALNEIDVALSSAEILVSAEHLPLLALKASITGFKTLGLFKLAHELEHMLKIAENEIKMLRNEVVME